MREIVTYGDYVVARMRRVDGDVKPITTIPSKPYTSAERLAGARERLIAWARSHGDNAALAIMGQPLV